MTILNLKKQLADTIIHHQQCQQLTQSELAQLLQISQPRVSDYYAPSECGLPASNLKQQTSSS